jgi:hypothetical protein
MRLAINEALRKNPQIVEAMYKKMINIMDECHQRKTEMGYSKL